MFIDVSTVIVARLKGTLGSVQYRLIQTLVGKSEHACQVCTVIGLDECACNNKHIWVKDFS